MRFRIPDWLVYLVLLSLLYGWARSSSERAPAPPPPPETLGDLLPEQGPRDEQVLVDIGDPESGVGTAFPIDRKGNWLTARHVVDGCDEIGLLADRDQAVMVDSWSIDPDADLAVLQTSWRRPPLPSDILGAKRIGQRGYFFGYPQGRPGEVVGSLLGRGEMRVRGRYRTREPVFAWAEVGRTRGLRGSLGGLSGAPVLDSDGEVIGVVAAENPRRGRIYTVAPVSLEPLFVDPREAPEPIAAVDYGTRADRYRRERRITQVLCQVD